MSYLYILSSKISTGLLHFNHMHIYEKHVSELRHDKTLNILQLESWAENGNFAIICSLESRTNFTFTIKRVSLVGEMLPIALLPSCKYTTKVLNYCIFLNSFENVGLILVKNKYLCPLLVFIRKRIFQDAMTMYL